MNKSNNDALIRKSQAQPAQTKTAGRSYIPYLIIVFIVACVIAVVWYVTHNKEGQGEAGKNKMRGRPPVTVGVAAAAKLNFPVALDELGTVTSMATATVRAQVSGVLQNVLFTEGQIVQRGQLLATIDPRPFEIALMQATGLRQRDEAQLENARVTEKRYRTLLSQDSIAQQDVDSQVALVRQLEGTVNVDKASERSAHLNLEFSRIAAPISGRIGLRTVDAGNLVSANDANGIVVITQINPIDVQFAVPQDQVPELRAALAGGHKLQVIAFDRARTNQLATGHFLAMDNQVDTQTGTVRAKARFDNAKGGLFPNQFVNVRVILRSIDGATALPVSAVRHGSEGDFVYVLNAEAKTVAQRPVKIGLSTVDKVQVLSGVEPGEQVITEGADRLTDGAQVKLPGTDKSKRAAGGEREEGSKRPRRNASGE